MSRVITVHLLPTLFEPDEVRDATAVIVDILRASTTMTQALASKAECVIPCATVDDALHLRMVSPQNTCLLGGERGGVKIPDFDLSNSPADYPPEVVQQRIIGFTTTNGTRALLRAKQARHVLIGAFVNLSAVVERLLHSTTDVHLVCAGTDGKITAEDVLFAGAVVAELQNQLPDATFTDSASIALGHWATASGQLTSECIEEALLKSQGGRNLVALGYRKDITTAASLNSVPVVGEVQADGAIRLAKDKQTATGDVPV